MNIHEPIIEEIEDKLKDHNDDVLQNHLRRVKSVIAELGELNDTFDKVHELRVESLGAKNDEFRTVENHLRNKQVAAETILFKRLTKLRNYYNFNYLTQIH